MRYYSLSVGAYSSLYGICSVSFSFSRLDYPRTILLKKSSNKNFDNFEWPFRNDAVI